MPTTSAPNSTGPPLLPLLIAASTWTASRLILPWLYGCRSMRETTPLVTQTLSPPCGKPTTMTSDCVVSNF